LHHRRAETQPRLGIEHADLRDHVREILVTDTAKTPQSSEIAFGDKIKMFDQNLHRRIVSVAVLELNGNALGQIARAYAGGIECLQYGEHELDVAATGAKLVCNGFDIAGQIAGLVDHIDKILADYAACRVGNRKRHLFGEMISERYLGRGKGFKVVVRGTRLPHTGPFRIGGLHFRRRRTFFSRIVGKYIFEFGAKALLDRLAASLEVGVNPV